MQYFKYKPYITPGPNGTSIYVKFKEVLEDNRPVSKWIGQEISRIDGIYYISIPDGETLAENQSDKLVIEPITLTPELLKDLKANSSFCQMISRLIIEKIRARYSVDDEAYYNRIGMSSALGIYIFKEGEKEELEEYNSFIEGIRQWGRDQRASIGL
jgi:hypothetical protein